MVLEGDLTSVNHSLVLSMRLGDYERGEKACGPIRGRYRRGRGGREPGSVW